MKKTFLCILLAFGATFGIVSYARFASADTPPDAAVVTLPAFTGSGSDGTAPVATAGSGSAQTPAPAAKLPNPVDDPLAVLDTLKAQKKQGWAPAILASLVMLTAGFARAATKWPSSKLFAWFAKNKTAIFVVSGLSVTSAAAFNALALGGTWMAAAYAAAIAAASLIHPGTPAPGTQA